MNDLIQKYEEIEKRFVELEHQMTEQAGNQDAYKTLTKKYAELEPPVHAYRNYKKVVQSLDEAQLIINDPTADNDWRALAEEEAGELETRREQLESTLQLFLIPQDPNDTKSCYLEIRAGTGGDEAAIFAGDLYSMYSRYLDLKKWSYETVDMTPSEAGGVKEIVLFVKGTGVYGRLKFEAGTHRVQRVPETEANGRVHTSAATVAVLPEVEDVDIEIRNEDIRIDTFRASGAGGQHINKTDSAIRITHLPTNMVVTCQDGRSQHQNKEQAMQLLRAKLAEKQTTERQDTEASTRRTQVGSGDRSEKIRTYNYPQSRLTDHRINFTSYNLPSFLHGNLDELIDALISADRAEKLAKE